MCIFATFGGKKLLLLDCLEFPSELQSRNGISEWRGLGRYPGEIVILESEKVNTLENFLGLQDIVE